MKQHDLIQHDLNARELATVLAALRHWQATGGRCSREIFDIATEAGEPLDEAEIDHLCQALNHTTTRTGREPR